MKEESTIGGGGEKVVSLEKKAHEDTAGHISSEILKAPGCFYCECLKQNMSKDTQ